MGHSSVSSGLDFHAFLWSAATGLVDLGTLGGQNSRATAIDNAGRVVGWSHTANMEIHAFMWTAAGGMVDLGMLDGIRTEPTDINDAGQVVGNTYDANGQMRAFMWTAASGMVALGMLNGATSSQALGINEAGQVVGISGTGTDSQRWRPFRWTASRGMVEIGAMHTLNSWASATAINESGEIAGSGSAWGPFHAGLWHPSEDLVLDFGPAYGVWTLERGGVWRQRHALSPDTLTLANFDVGFALDSMHDDLVFDFGPGIGLWALMNHTTWRSVHPFSPTLVVSGDLDGDSTQTPELICVFPGYGIYRTNGPNFWWPFPLHTLEPALMAVGELDGTSGKELLASFPGQGLWRYDHGVGWSLFHPLDASKLLMADIDGDGSDDGRAFPLSSFGCREDAVPFRFLPQGAVRPSSIVSGGTSA